MRSFSWLKKKFARQSVFVKRKISLPLIPLCEQFLETYRLLILTPTKMAYGDDKLEREAADFKDDCSYLSNYN